MNPLSSRTGGLNKTGTGTPTVTPVERPLVEVPVSNRADHWKPLRRGSLTASQEHDWNQYPPTVPPVERPLVEVPGSSRTDHWQPLKGFLHRTAPTGSLYRPEPVPPTVTPVERPLVEVPGSSRTDHWQPLKGFLHRNSTHR